VTSKEWPKSKGGVSVFAVANHVVDSLVDIGLSTIGIRVEVEDGVDRFAELDDGDEVLRWSDINAANDPVDESLY